MFVYTHKRTQADMNTENQSDSFTAMHEHTHAGSNPVECTELFSVTAQHCSVLIFTAHARRVRGQVVSSLLLLTVVVDRRL